jgi:hypothetical protein
MQQSDNQIARHIGVSHSTVAKYRSELEVTCQVGKSSGQDVQDSGVPTSTRVRTGRDGRRINTAKIGRTQHRDPFKPSRYMASRVHQPIRQPVPAPKMTALNMPHNPVMGARTLIELFDADYLRALNQEITRHLQGVEART